MVILIQMELISPAFKNYTYMPAKYSCQGEEINPPLEISGVPDEAKSLVLIVVDSDIPFPFPAITHWLICYLDPTTTQIEEGSKLDGAIAGKNFHRGNAYLGPCPPYGTHKYTFTIYALDTKLPFTTNSTRRKVLKAIKGHVIAQAELVGLYKKQKKAK